MIKAEKQVIYLSSFTDRGKLYFLKNPIRITVQKDNDFFVLFNKKVNVHAYDEDLKEAYEIFEEIFITQYELTKEEDKDLTKGARQLKEYLLDLVYIPFSKKNKK